MADSIYDAHDNKRNILHKHIFSFVYLCKHDGEGNKNEMIGETESCIGLGIE